MSFAGPIFKLKYRTYLNLREYDNSGAPTPSWGASSLGTASYRDTSMKPALHDANMLKILTTLDQGVPLARPHSCNMGGFSSSLLSSHALSH